MSQSKSSAPKRLPEVLRGASETYLGRFLVFVTALILVVLLLDRHDEDDFPQWSPDVWSAVAESLTALVAIVAVVVAVHQLRDARELRWEQALPYVVAHLEPDQTDPKIVYLVIKNLGSTAATQLGIECEPAPTRSDGVGGGDLAIPATVPAMVPGQEWRTFWDFSPFRSKQSGLPDEHVLTIRYMDGRGREQCTESVVDWRSLMNGRTWISRNSIHSIGTSLKSIDKSLQQLVDVRESEGEPTEAASLSELSKWFDVEDSPEEPPD